MDGVCRFVCLSSRPARHRPRGRVPHRWHRAPGCAGSGGRWFRDRGGSRNSGLGYDALSATLHQGNVRDTMRRTVVINAVGLTPDHLGVNTPCLSAFAEKGTLASVTPPLPAVTCTAQATYVTGTRPD